MYSFPYIVLYKNFTISIEKIVINLIMISHTFSKKGGTPPSFYIVQNLASLAPAPSISATGETVSAKHNGAHPAAHLTVQTNPPAIISSFHFDKTFYLTAFMSSLAVIAIFITSCLNWFNVFP